MKRMRQLRSRRWLCGMMKRLLRQQSHCRQHAIAAPAAAPVLAVAVAVTVVGYSIVGGGQAAAAEEKTGEALGETNRMRAELPVL